MIVGIHQPNYIPWIGFFHKMHRSDVFVLLDTAPYTKNGYQNRCMIKGPQGAFWLTVPVLTKGRSGQLTKDVDINNSAKWRDKHWKSILQNYSKARCFQQHSDFFEGLYEREWSRLVDINETIITHIVQELGIQTRLISASTLQVSGGGSELLLSICKSIGADTYLSGPSGKRYLNQQRFEEEAILLRYHDFHHPTYDQLGSAFVQGLSVIDLIFNHGDDSLSILEGASGPS